MDLRYTPPEGPGAAPSFLYALPLDDHHVFFEETSLVRSPGLPLDTLRERLAHRLKRSGVEVLSVLDEERCVIPMGLPPPEPAALVVAFGAAAGMVHPATGYQLCHALQLAPALATILDEGLSSSSPEEACRRAANLVWPASRARLWALYRFGMAALCGFDLERTRAFFDSFYRLPTRDWTRYVDATASATEVGAIMVRLFLRTQPHLRLELLRHGLGPGRAELWRAASGAVS